MRPKKPIEKKIVSLNQEELSFLRDAIIKTYGSKIDSPGDKSSYESINTDISKKLNIKPSEQRHSPGLLHKLLHDEGYNIDFIDTCYRYISENKHDRESFLRENSFQENQFNINEIENRIIDKKWKKRFAILALFCLTCFCISSILYIQYLHKKSNTTTTWNMSTAWNADSYTQNGYLEEFVNEVKIQTKGKLIIRILPDYQLPNSNGHSQSREQVFESLKEGSIQMIHSGSKSDYKMHPERVMFSSIPFGKNYDQMITWLEKPKIKEALKNVLIEDGIFTFEGGHSGEQYGGWYKELPTSPNFFKGKTVRFANFAGFLLSQPSIGAKLKPMLRYQFQSMIDHISYDVVEWQNPEEDLKLGMNLKGFRYYDKSNWSEPDAMFCFFINKVAINQLQEEERDILLKLISKFGKRKLFSDNSVNRQLAENIIENTTVLNTNQKIKIFNLKEDFPETYKFLKMENEKVLANFISKNPKMKWLYDDYYAK